MARPKGSKNKKKIAAHQTKAADFDTRAELIALYRSIKTTPKTLTMKLEILREIKGK